MTRSDRIAGLFAGAHGLAPADRAAFLDRECGDDPALLAEVLDLLGQDEQADREDFLGSPTRPARATGPAAEPVGVPGRYADLRDPRRGGMGVVYRARDLELGRDVAYKVMNAEGVDPEEFRARFAREARITARLQYPGIVPVFAMTLDGCGRPAYAMQYIEGVDFRDLVPRKGASSTGEGPARERLEAFLGACRIVGFAHRKGYVHGDLSPTNLMIVRGEPDPDEATHRHLSTTAEGRSSSPLPPGEGPGVRGIDSPVGSEGTSKANRSNGHAPHPGPGGEGGREPTSGIGERSRAVSPADRGAVFVVDWGLARRFGPAGSIGEVDVDGPLPGSPEPATPHFAAPSVLKGGPRTFATDVYSLGAILASLALGVTPGGRPDLGAARRGVPRPLRAIIDAAMLDREGGPYPSADALADDLRRFLDGEKPAVDAEPWRERAWRSIRRHPARTTLAVATVLLVSVVSTSAALVVAARDRAARKDEEAATARQQALGSQATMAMIRAGMILNRSPQTSLVETGKLEAFLRLLAPMVKEKDLPIDVNQGIRASDEALRQDRARQDARGREAAESDLREVIAILSRLEGQVPDPQVLRYYLVKCYYGLGVLETTRAINGLGLVKYLLIMRANLAGRPPSQPEVEAGLARIEKAMELLPTSSPVPSEPESPRVLEQAMWKGRWLCQVQLGRFTEAMMSLDRALALAEGHERVSLEKLRASFLKAAEVEQSHLPWSRPPRVAHDRALRMADYLLAQPTIGKKAVFNAACAYSLASVEDRASPAERERRASRAVDWLARLEAQRAFRGPDPAGDLAGDKDLEPLRHRDDFRALAARVAKGG